MLVIDLEDSRPLYQQVVDGIKAAIASGDIKPGVVLPSVRELAQSLSINPNTVARAYRDLNNTGVIVVRQGKGAWVSQPPPEPDAEQLQQLRERLCRLLDDAYHLGIDDRQVARMLAEIIQQKESS